MTAAANSPAATEGVRGGESFPELRRHDRIVWQQPDGARVFVIVSRISSDRRIAWLKCHYGDKTWIRKHAMPLFPSMHRRHWTTDDLAETK